jgi:outer membrane protein W
MTTDYFNNVFQAAAVVSGQYYFPIGDNEHFFPYAGLGLGANRNSYSVSYNIYNDEEQHWGFLARPEAGMVVRIGSRRKFGLLAAVHYDFSTNKSENYGYKNFSTVGFQLGVMVTQW